MKKNSFFQHYCKWALLAIPIIPVLALAETPNKEMLPEDMKVYYKENMISRAQFKGGNAKLIPVNNEYKENPGCYLACFSRNKSHHAVYHISDNIYMMGQFRVPGHYTNGFCLPKGYDFKDVRKSNEFKERCEKVFPEKCQKGSCWANANTSYWFMYKSASKD